MDFSRSERTCTERALGFDIKKSQVTLKIYVSIECKRHSPNQERLGTVVGTDYYFNKCSRGKKKTRKNENTIVWNLAKGKFL